MNPSELYDRGAQPERTLLAWGRTCLALAVVLALAIKLLAADSDAALVVLVPLGLALPLAGWLLAAARYRRVHHELTGPAERLPAAGTALGVVTGGAVVAGVLALLLVLAG